MTDANLHKKEVVPSRIELLILALLAPRLNQLGQGTLITISGVSTSGYELHNKLCNADKNNKRTEQ